MSELIDRQAALKQMCEMCGGFCEKVEKAMRATHPGFVITRCNHYNFLAEQPTIEADIYCDAEYCEYNEGGMCRANQLEMDGNGVCVSIKTVVRTENEATGDTEIRARDDDYAEF